MSVVLQEELRVMREAAVELAQYASYAEIVHGISVNRPEIRRCCDAVFRLQAEHRKRVEAEEDRAVRLSQGRDTPQ